MEHEPEQREDKAVVHLEGDDVVLEGDECEDDGDDEKEDTSKCLFFVLSVLNASSYTSMMLAEEWAGPSLQATTWDYATRLIMAPWVESAVWSAITLSLMAFLLWPFLPWLSRERKLDVLRLSQPLVLACVSHALSSVLWSYGFLSLSTLMSVTVCGQLLAIGLVLNASPLLFRLPFGLWFGWAAFATLSQATAALYHEVHIAFFGSSCWAAAGMLSLSALAYTWGSLADDPFFSSAVVMAFFGVSQQHHSLVVTRVAYACCIAVAAHALICVINVWDDTRRQDAGDPLTHLDDDAYDREEAALLSCDEGSDVPQQPDLPSAPLLSLPIEDSRPLYPIIYAPQQPPMAAAGEELGDNYYNASYSSPCLYQPVPTQQDNFPAHFPAYFPAPSVSLPSAVASTTQ